jgi:DNA-binding GntR family transcriptional regulator
MSNINSWQLPVISLDSNRSTSGQSVASALYRTREGRRRRVNRGNIGYRAIADALREEIDAGRLPPGSKVPGENELMSTYGVEQPTARRALDVLKNEG